MQFLLLQVIYGSCVSDLSNLLTEIKQDLFVICIYLTLVPLQASKRSSYSFLGCQFSPTHLSS